MAKVFSTSLETIQKSLKELYPELELTAPLHHLGEGFGSLVLETPTGIVFRIAKNHIVHKRHQREFTLLGILNNKISGFSIPQPLFYADSSKMFPFGLIGYQKIEGRVLKPRHLNNENLEGIASSIAEFIDQLQSVEITKELKQISLPTMPPKSNELIRVWGNIYPYLKQQFNSEDFQNIAKWWNTSFEYWNNYQYNPVLVHGDLWYENIIVSSDHKRVKGIIGFERIAVGDPMADFVTQKYLGPEFLNEVVRKYQRLNNTVESAQLEYHLDRLMGLRELMGLEYGIETNFIDEDTITKIRNSILKDF